MSHRWRTAEGAAPFSRTICRNVWLATAARSAIAFVGPWPPPDFACANHREHRVDAVGQQQRSEGAVDQRALRVASVAVASVTVASVAVASVAVASVAEPEAEVTRASLTEATTVSFA